mmetsp:Transcript_53014/g.113319  ORF Transcript_53014/g.113319 Transcript_53014/m.113319 type:complete len:218 (-) Transcript_53014:20-673(-)
MSVSPRASHFAMSASTAGLAATLLHWSALSVAPFIIFSSRSTICLSRFLRFLSFFSTSLSPFWLSCAESDAGAAGGEVAAGAVLLAEVASCPRTPFSPVSASGSACCSAFRRALRFAFFAAVLLPADAFGTSASGSAPTTPTCASLFHLSYFSCSSGGTYPFFTRTAGRSEPSGRLDCGSISYISSSATVGLFVSMPLKVRMDALVRCAGWRRVCAE